MKKIKQKITDKPIKMNKNIYSNKESGGNMDSKRQKRMKKIKKNL